MLASYGVSLALKPSYTEHFRSGSELYYHYTCLSHSWALRREGQSYHVRVKHYIKIIRLATKTSPLLRSKT